MGKKFGLDIGTSKICLVVVEDGKAIYTRAEKNTFLREKEQDPTKIFEICAKLIGDAEKAYGKPSSLGISTQMHGMLYLDGQGNALSPLYTWQDDKGGRLFQGGKTYARYLSEESGYRVASGFGLVTHYYMLKNNAVPRSAEQICTIGDYVAMRLTGNTRCVMHPSCAASFGFYDFKTADFDRSVLKRLGFDPQILPPVNYRQEIPVIGDNQASFAGAVEDEKNSVLVNIGTGSQVSVVTAKDTASAGELRPFSPEKNLLVGSALCGGYAYSLLAKFFLSVADMFNFTPEEDIFECMNRAAKQESDLVFDTSFSGNREDPAKRASVTMLSEKNFTAGDMIFACVRGIVRELKDIYSDFGEPRSKVVAAGNGIRKNALMRELIARDFGSAPMIPPNGEEAACGAALWKEKA